ncbi:FYVE-domain-containing protein [Bimuria novae-zelandiae CBS 107.79]|uniref:RING-type E3 ubiquitin transferase n=1 Tax=Bimuria novae-zelandiae CBS 107.79 TaxID=1447943 RepID=A0A6A5VQ76_9PLEO|nr:FYVE-domain-containing protein [Bimuria novae-zelandiae CBS 107.79]
MTSTTPPFRRSRSLSSSSSSSDASHEFPTSRSPIRRHQIPAMNGRTAFSQSSPNLESASRTSGTTRDASSIRPPRTHSHSAVTSHDAYGGQTWMDFLRDPNASLEQGPAQPQSQPNLHAPLPPLPPDARRSHTLTRYSFPARSSSHTAAGTSRSSSERKRRLTTTDSPLRRPSSIRMHSENQVGSSSNSVVLASSPAADASRRQPPPPPPPAAARRDSDFVLPSWQPDSEVTHCFVCGSHFTFFYRKHHCRKCGRVVCSACSPHRITIPRQYIVHPPQENLNIVDLASEDDDHPMSRYGPFSNPALGGGEGVRVCNPCVPDPNYSPPPQHGQISPFSPFSPSAHSPHLPPSTQVPRGSRSSHRSTQSISDSTHTGSRGHGSRSSDVFTDRRTSYHGATRVSDLWPPAQAPPAYHHRSRPHSRSMLGSSDHTRPDPSNFPEHNMPGSRHSFFATRPQPPSSPQPQPAPRRQIAEEDECPVCGNELPPKGPDGDETARTQHVEECIAMYSGSPPPAPIGNPTEQTSTSLPSQRTRGMSSAAGIGEGSSNRMSLSMRGLVPYVATEKDRVDEDGNEAECVICFEEFEAGDRMARLVCWCKFHEACIREWWDKKGRGACPTHQLH